MEHTKTIESKLYDPKFMKTLSQKLGQNAEEIVYERIFGEEKRVQVSGKNYTLLPIGNRNKRVQGILDGKIPRGRGVDSISGAVRVLTSKLEPITYEDANSEYIMDSYIKHYHDTLGEEWSKKDFYERIKSLLYVSCKYAIDEATGEKIIVGFFGVQIATGAGGKYLTNGELYVLPGFRGKNIAVELVSQTFGLAAEDGIENFDSLTYSIPDNDSLAFWKHIGADETELYHIAGSVSEILNSMSNKRS